MSSDNSSISACPLCIENGVPATYPVWRQHIAIGFICIHIVISLITVVIGWRWRDHPEMRWRDPPFLVMMFIGSLATLHTPIRELIGEGQYPCISHVVMVTVVNVFLILPVPVRSIRLAALHCLQLRLASLVTGKPSSRSPMYVALSEQSEGAAWYTGDSHATNNNINEAHVLEAQPDCTVAYLGPSSTAMAEIQSVASSGREVPYAVASVPIIKVQTDHQRGLRSWCSKFECASEAISSLLLDKFGLHQPKSVGVLWAAMSVVLVCVVISRSVGSLQPFACACTFTASDQSVLVIMAIIFCGIELCVIAYSCGRPDAFHLKQENLVLAFSLIVASFLVTAGRASQQVKSVTNPSYVFVISSWIAMAVTVLTPASRAYSSWRKTRRCISPMLALQSPPASTNGRFIAVKSNEVLHFMKEDDIEAAPLRTRNSLLSIYVWVVLKGIDIQTEADLNSVRTYLNGAFAQVIDAPIAELTPELLQVLCVLMCSTKIGQYHFRPLLARQFSLELLAFLVDGARLRHRLDKLYFAVSERLAEHANGRQPSAVTQPLFTLVENVKILAKELLTKYLADRAMYPINISAMSLQQTQRAVEYVAAKCDNDTQNKQEGGQVSQDIAAMLDNRPCLTGCFKEVVDILCYGPVLQFRESSDFEQLKAQWPLSNSA